MLHDSFGIIGLMVALKTAKSKSNLDLLFTGYDINTLGLDLTSRSDVLPFLSSPLLDTPKDVINMCNLIPPEYRNNEKIQ